MNFGTKSEKIREAQIVLAGLGLYHLAIDGVFGPGTQRGLLAYQEQRKITPVSFTLTPELSAMLARETVKARGDFYSAPEITDRMRQAGYEVRTKRYYVNMVGLRMNNRYENDFSDRLALVWTSAPNKWEYREYKWTTMPGTLGQGTMNPITVLGITGTAVLKAGQYKDAYQFMDTYQGWLRYPYWQQVRPVTVYRDGDRDFELELNAPNQVGLFGINLHRMSNDGVETNTLNQAWVTWSMGCQGAPEPTFRRILPFAREHVRFHGTIFDYSVLEMF
ncbi:MAG: peptidoglycan-binding domain-containing protein [Leptolyngbyaceae bacterium]|nr:peptidoglycan-binding domain-containing protein [Leptolyngbyaceae bacterium]